MDPLMDPFLGELENLKIAVEAGSPFSTVEDYIGALTASAHELYAARIRPSTGIDQE
jgi:hypothetical protein